MTIHRASIRLLPLLAALAFGSAACAQSTAPGAGQDAAQPAATDARAASKAAPADPRAAIAGKLEVPVDAVKPGPIEGIYEVVHGAEVLYATADARFVFDGELYDLDRRANVSEERRAGARVAALAAVREEDAISFGPKDAKYTITVFTDIDCGFCRKLHQEVEQYNGLGIRVRYLAYPRGGPGSEAWAKAQSVWCAPNRQDAMTRAKNGEAMPTRNCKDSAVPKDYELGGRLGVQGTPGIYTERGDYIKGYLPPDRMLERLQALEAAAQGGAPQPN